MCGGVLLLCCAVVERRQGRSAVPPPSAEASRKLQHDLRYSLCLEREVGLTNDPKLRCYIVKLRLQRDSKRLALPLRRATECVTHPPFAIVEILPCLAANVSYNAQGGSYAAPRSQASIASVVQGNGSPGDGNSSCSS